MHITNIINTRVFDCLFIATIISISLSALIQEYLPTLYPPRLGLEGRRLTASALSPTMSWQAPMPPGPT